jgi:succinyl-diaminopimelate desuccinylase
MALDPTGDIITLLGALVDIRSESLAEGDIADALEAALSGVEHLTVERDGNSVVARTQFGLPDRVLICGHIDTVPEADNLPHFVETVEGEERLVGLGSCDMKGGVAVAVALAAQVSQPTRDITFVFYEAEEIDERYNGLKRLALTRPDLLEGDFAVLMEPSDAGVEAGCQGTLRAEIHIAGRRSHSARSWLGVNAIHGASDVLTRLAEYQPSRVIIDGLEYREGLNAVGITGGVAGNVIPDECVVTVNYRFAPTLTPELAATHVQTIFEGFDVRVVDAAAGALPGLSQPAAKAFLEVTGSTPRPKFGWTDVARFTTLGIPAVNFGPGDPSLAHTREEYVPTSQVRSTFEVMRAWLVAPVPARDVWAVDSSAAAPGQGWRSRPLSSRGVRES